MSKTRILQITIVVVIVIITVIIYRLPISKPSGEITKEKPENNKNALQSFDEKLAALKKSINPQQLETINAYEKKLASEQAVLQFYDSIAFEWDKLNQPSVSAHYFEEKALKDNNENSYINAAYRYFDAFKLAEDSANRTLMVEKAIKCYEKVLEINPKNLDAKTDLGICYAEGTNAPMKGILMLREVVQEKPDHENAQLNLGFLSVKSNQYDKALQRFDKVLELNPTRLEVYIYKAQTFLEMGDTTEARQNIATYIALIKDEKLKENAENFLKSLQN